MPWRSISAFILCSKCQSSKTFEGGGYRATITSAYSFMILWEWYWAKDNKNPSKELASCEHMCESLSWWGRGGRRVTGDPRGSRGDEHSAQNFNLHHNSPVPQSPASSDLGQCRSLSALVTPLFSEIPISSITRFSGTFVTYCLPLTPAQLDYELSEGMNLFKMYQKKKKTKREVFIISLFYFFTWADFHKNSDMLCAMLWVYLLECLPQKDDVHITDWSPSSWLIPGGLQLPRERGDKRVFAKQYYLCELLGLWINSHGL